MTAPAPWTLERLDETSQSNLNDLFRTSPAGPMPDGDAQGVAIVGKTVFWRRWIAKFAHSLLWQGKVFKRADDGHASLVNKITAAGIDEIHANIYRGPSRFDQQECIVLDYSKTSFLARKVRDEIRQVAPGVYLGLVYWGSGTKPLIDFALDFTGGTL